MARVKTLLAVTLLAGGALTLSLLSPKPTVGNLAQASATVSPLLQHANPQQARLAYGQLPMAFEPNVGQTDARVKFMARGSKYGLFLTNHEAVLSLAHASSPLQMSLANSNPNAEVSGTDALPGKSNYLIGRDRSRWHTDVPQFSRVRYNQVYPGVDLVYYGKQGELEYDFQLAPGADPKQVALQFAGADKLRLDVNGDLLLGASGGEMRLHAPLVYQTIAGEKTPVDGKFVLLAEQQVGFEIGNYDRDRELVIDPILTYSTYLGGSGAEDAPVTLAVDNAQSTYIAGSTTSADFPIQTTSATVPSAFQSCLDNPTQPQPTSCTPGTNSDAFIAKLSPAGDAVIFATYLGGAGVDSANGVAIDSGFDVIITGNTTSADFPVANAFQGSQGPSASTHAFVSKVDPNGHSLLYSTYLRGSGSETAAGVAVDFRGKVYVIGTTNSSDFPVTPDAFQSTPKATQQVFVSKIDPATSANASLVYSTYFGGGDPASGTVTAGGIAVDKNNTTVGVYITGYTNFQHTGGNPALDFPILNAPQGCLNDSANHSPCLPAGTKFDAFIAKLNPTAPIGSHLIYSTYYGGANDDLGLGVAVDSGGSAYITGRTSSADLPQPTSTSSTSLVAFQKCLGLGSTANPASCSTSATGTDAFLAKFSAFTSGTTTTPNVTVMYASYVGGGDVDEGHAITVDTSSGAYITGTTQSVDFPVLRAPAGRGSLAGGKDAFVTRIDTTATTQAATTHFSFYLGGSGLDNGTGIAVDSTNGVYVAGSTQSANFPTTAGAFQTGLSGSSDAFVAKLGPALNSISMNATTTAPKPNPVGVGGSVTFTYTITNTGDVVPGATFVDNVDTTLGSFVSISGENCGTLLNNTVTCSLGPLTSTAKTITVVVAPKSHEPPGSFNYGNSANLTSPVSKSASNSVLVNDYILALTPNSATVKAGSAATYTAQVTPTGSGFPGSVSVSCTGLPTGASCSVANGSITNLNTGPQSRAVVVNTTVRNTTTAELRRHGLVYAVWFPVSGLAFLGLGVGGTLSRKRRAALGLLIGTFFVLVFLQAGCGSSSSGTTTTTGTPAGTYTFTVTASSGTGASHSQVAQLIVQ